MSGASALHQRLHCKSGRFSIDPRTGRITDQNGSVTTLRPKPMALLLFLVGHAGELVCKKEILACVWPGEVVGDSALRTALFEVRRAIGDDDRDDPVIQTFPKQGYRLCGNQLDPLPSQTEESTKRNWLQLLCCGLLLTTIGLSFGIWSLLSHQRNDFGCEGTVVSSISRPQL